MYREATVYVLTRRMTARPRRPLKMSKLRGQLPHSACALPMKAGVAGATESARFKLRDESYGLGAARVEATRVLRADGVEFASADWEPSVANFPP